MLFTKYDVIVAKTNNIIIIVDKEAAIILINKIEAVL